MLNLDGICLKIVSRIEEILSSFQFEHIKSQDKERIIKYSPKTL